jgi:hypothetical protein
MTEARAAAIQIGQLNLRIPGNSAEVGHRVAHGMAESLAQQVPSGLREEFGALNVRVHLPPGASEADMSEAIAQAIIIALQKRN